MNNSNEFLLFYIKLGCLLFFGIWFSIAFTTNILDFINGLYGLPPAWTFCSGNYQALATVLSRYNTPTIILNILFTLDILAQGTSAILFLIAGLFFWRGKNSYCVVNIAFGISMALWAIFLIMEEIFIAYSFEGTHMRLFAFEMLTLMMMHLLPGGKHEV